MSASDFGADVQAEAKAGGFIAPSKGLEDRGQAGGGNSRAPIGDGEHELIGVAGCAHRDRAARLAMRDGVRDEVGQHLLDPACVTAHRLFELDLSVQGMRRRGSAKLLHDLGEAGREVRCLA